MKRFNVEQTDTITKIVDDFSRNRTMVDFVYGHAHDRTSYLYGLAHGLNIANDDRLALEASTARLINRLEARITALEAARLTLPDILAIAECFDETSDSGNGTFDEALEETPAEMMHRMTIEVQL